MFAPPTLLRKLSQLPIDFEGMDFDLRIILSAGEPLNPGTVTWAEETFGVMMVDHRVH